MHVPSDDIYTCLSRCARLQGRRQGVDLLPRRAHLPGLRELRPGAALLPRDDKPRAEQIAGLFGTLGLELNVKDISATEWARSNAPNSYELWFNGKPLPKICQQAASD